jgi:SAM-dependent methyltransferase
MNMENWFESWFDSPYYAMLYPHRDQSEASRFIDRLLGLLAIPPGSRVLDLACGTGRHSIRMAELGYSVTGIDLSQSSIDSARQHAHPGLSFLRADMRTFDTGECYDLIVNLFTSFGYFNDSAENERVLSRVFAHLMPGGWFVLDFLNADHVRAGLVSAETVQRNGVTFHITRDITETHVLKHIRFKAEGKEYEFVERVQFFSRSALERMIGDAGLLLCHTFGDYFLNPIQPGKSDRVILAARKPS